MQIVEKHVYWSNFVTTECEHIAHNGSRDFHELRNGANVEPLSLGSPMKTSTSGETIVEIDSHRSLQLKKKNSKENHDYTNYCSSLIWWNNILKREKRIRGWQETNWETCIGLRVDSYKPQSLSDDSETQHQVTIKRGKLLLRHPIWFGIYDLNHIN